MMVYVDKKDTPWHSKKVYDEHVRDHAAQHNGLYLQEIHDAYQTVLLQSNELWTGQEFVCAGRQATIRYLGVDDNKHKYEVKVGISKRLLVLTDEDWSVVTYHKINN